MRTFEKDPDAVLDYQFDWSKWLDGDTITDVSVSAEDGITVDSHSEDDTGREDDRSFIAAVREL